MIITKGKKKGHDTVEFAFEIREDFGNGSCGAS
jgi:hypothetical protein